MFENKLPEADFRAHPSQLFEFCSEQIRLAIKDRKHSFHIMQVATNDGDYPQIRSVVMRNYEPNLFELYFHTDVRSPKFSQLSKNTKIAFHFYCPNLKIQVRGIGQAKAVDHRVEKYQKHLQSISLSGARCYLGPLIPGESLLEYSPNIHKEWVTRAPRKEEIQNGIPNFELIQIQIEKVDCLQLTALGHIRTSHRVHRNDGVIELEHFWVAP